MIFYSLKLVFYLLRCSAQQPSPQPSQHHSHVEVSKPSEVEAPPSTAQQASTPRSLDVHGKDAFNRLIASIRATDKVKEQMQQRVSSLSCS